MKNLIKQIGQLFVFSFEGDTPPEAFLSLLASEQVGGVILFESNCPSLAQTRENIRLINQRLTESPALVAIDQEGGSVCRIKGAPAEYGSAAHYAASANIENFAQEYSRAVMLMTSLGINLNLAPVADIAINNQNQVLADRCYGNDPETVTKFVETSVRVARNNRMLSCLKHFPGLGAATVDPHRALATADYDRVVWEQREKLPFVAGVEAGADLIMTTHLLVDQIDSKMATASEKLCVEILRGELDFDGPVITDDLVSMKGADSLGSYGERAVTAFLAGHDLLLYCHDYEAGMEAYEFFIKAVESREIPKERIAASLARIGGVKLNLGRSVVV